MQRIVVDKVFVSTDFLCIQETVLPKQDLDKLNSVHDTFCGAGESTTDLSMGIIRGRIPGGVAIFWRKKYYPPIVLTGLQQSYKKSTFIILNVYTPYENY